MSVLPPSVAFCIKKNLLASGSEYYRIHRPAHLLGHKENWLTFVATHFAPPEVATEPWRIQIQDEVLTPQVIVSRPIWKMEDDLSDADAADEMTQSIAWAQENGQIVLGDIDDHPFSWNEEFAEREDFGRIDDWSWYDRWISQFNAVLVSTPYLMDFLVKKYPEQRFVYAPNCYDPWRYDPSKATFGKNLGCHLWVKARFRDDFQQLGQLLNPVFNTDDDLRFVHMGDEMRCLHCDHGIHAHYDNKYCDECTCEDYGAAPITSLADISGMPRDRIIAKTSTNILDLPEQIDWNVGVIPLADNEFNYAKTEGKGFEMSAAGIPFLALTGKHPLYARTPGAHFRKSHTEVDLSHQIAQVIKALTTDEAYWQKRSGIHRKWSVKIAQEHEDRYCSALKQLSTSDLRK